MSHASPLEYAPSQIAKPPAHGLYLGSLRLSAIAAGAGVLILLAFVVGEWTSLVFVGFAWLAIGGGLTLLGFVLGVTYAATAFGRRFPPPATRRRALVAVLVPLAVGPLAIACAIGGLAKASALARTVIVTNASDAAIDEAQVIGRSAVSIGRIEPGQTRRGRVSDGSEHMSVALRATGETRYYELESYRIGIPGDEPIRVTLDADGTMRRTDGTFSRSPIQPTTLPAEVGNRR